MCQTRATRSLYDYMESGVNTIRDLRHWEARRIEQQVRQRVHQIGIRMSNMKVPPALQEFIDYCKNYAAQNPTNALIIGALLLTCLLPVVIFLAFALSTLLVTFLGFIFVEGTVLTIGTVILGTVLLCVGCSTVFVLGIGIISYFVATKLYSLITGDQNPHRFLKQIPVIGFLFESIVPEDSNTSNGTVPRSRPEENKTHTQNNGNNT